MKYLRQFLSILAGALLFVVSGSCVSTTIQDRELAALFVLGYKFHDMARISGDVANNLGGIIWFRPDIKSPPQMNKDIAALKTIN